MIATTLLATFLLAQTAVQPSPAPQPGHPLDPRDVEILTGRAQREANAQRLAANAYMYGGYYGGLGLGLGAEDRALTGGEFGFGLGLGFGFDGFRGNRRVLPFSRFGFFPGQLGLPLGPRFLTPFGGRPFRFIR
jgi:hypothetical protein